MCALGLRTLLDGALTAGLVTSGGCCFGRAYGPSNRVEVSEPPAGLVEKATVMPDGELDDESCVAACGGNVVSCALAEGDPNLPTAPPRPRTISCTCRDHGRGLDYQRSIEVPPERLNQLQPDERGDLDPHECFEPVPCCGPEIAVVSCRLDPPARPKPVLPKERFVVCHTRTPGGCDMSFGHGRAPSGLELPTRGADTPGGYLARAAYLEHASVQAFRTLVRELEAVGAPRHLVARARRSAREERKHARVTAVMARRFGARVSRPRILATRSRSLLEIAVENAVEGCVRETFGTLVAMHQARMARDTAVRDAMIGIAEDETRHAELAWEVHAWCLQELGEEQAAHVRAAMRTAVNRLTGAAWSDGVREPMGLPTELASRAMIEWLRARLWNGCLASDHS
jgi:hypothetical protein